MFQESVDTLVRWAEANRTDPELLELIKDYLLGRDLVPMSELTGSASKFSRLAMCHDKLGWDNFLEGRICVLFLDHQKSYLDSLPPSRYNRFTPERWAQGLISRLLELTHRQWLYRNSYIYFTKVEGRTEIEHNQVISKVKELLYTDPSELLPRHRPLLEIDFAKLGAGSTIGREFWIASVDSAISAAEAHRKLRRSRFCSGPTIPDPTATRVDMPIITERGIRYKKRRKRK